MVQEILLGLQECQQSRSGQVGIKLDSEAMLRAIEANLLSSTRRVSGEHGISQTSVVLQLPTSAKASGAAEFCFTLSKYCKKLLTSHSQIFEFQLHHYLNIFP